MNLDLTQAYYTELANRTHDLIVEREINKSLNKLLQDKDKEIERLKKLLDDNNVNYKTDEKMEQKESVWSHSFLI